MTNRHRFTLHSSLLLSECSVDPKRHLPVFIGTVELCGETGSEPSDFNTDACAGSDVQFCLNTASACLTRYYGRWCLREPGGVGIEEAAYTEHLHGH